MSIKLGYDDGAPFYMKVIDSWIERRTPAWKGSLSARCEKSLNLKDWFKKYCKGIYTYELRFNSGNPTIFFSFEDPDDAMLFKLTWMDDED